MDFGLISAKKWKKIFPMHQWLLHYPTIFQETSLSYTRLPKSKLKKFLRKSHFNMHKNSWQNSKQTENWTDKRIRHLQFDFLIDLWFYWNDFFNNLLLKIKSKNTKKERRKKLFSFFKLNCQFFCCCIFRERWYFQKKISAIWLFVSVVSILEKCQHFEHNALIEERLNNQTSISSLFEKSVSFSKWHIYRELNMLRGNWFLFFII